MSLSFPTSPTVGQTYQGFVWTGSAWSAIATLQPPAPGSRVLLASQVVAAPVASVVFSAAGMTNGGLGNTAFNEFVLELNSFDISAAAYTVLQWSTDGGTTFDTTANYYTTFMQVSASGVTYIGAGFGYAVLSASGYANAAQPFLVQNATFRFFQPWSTTGYKLGMNEWVGYIDPGSPGRVSGYQAYQSVNGPCPAVNAFRVMPSSAANFRKGNFKLYGIQS